IETLVSKALMIRLSLQPAPASETSAFNNILAFSSRCAGLLPFRISASSRSRSSPLSRTTYFFTEISFAAMIASVARVVMESNHKSSSFQINGSGRLGVACAAGEHPHLGMRDAPPVAQQLQQLR